jgi:Na+/melibiose symporter-like transporter
MNTMTSSGTKFALPLCLIVVGLALGAAGIYIGDTDDAPGAALIGIVLMITAVVFGVRMARRKA